MPRLTRTQKYADLREQLANDKEDKITPSDLDSYQNRLNNIQDTLSFFNQVIEEEPVIEEVPVEDSKYVWKPFEGDTFSQPVTPIEEVKVEETPVIEETKQNGSFFESFMGEPINNNQNHDFKSYFEDENTNKDVFGDVSDDSGEIVSQKERDTYLNQTLTDVFSYNEQSGEDTINTILNNSVDEVRHGEENAPIEEAVELDADIVEEEPKINDEEFSNTVSMEITKIMDELASVPIAPVQEEEKVEEVVEINEIVPEEKAEEVVEIKNIAEVEKEEKQKGTMSNTIPFIVNTDEEELEEDDEEEDGSNTVLNVILIVLIVVLVAVLGLIVFYILKTKGIF